MGTSFQRRFRLVGQGVTDAKGVSIFILMRFHGSLLALMPEPPAPLVRRFMDGDTVEPGLQAALAVETLHAAKNFEKHFLRRIRGIRRIAQDAIDQAVDRL